MAHALTPENINEVIYKNRRLMVLWQISRFGNESALRILDKEIADLTRIRTELFGPPSPNTKEGK